MQDYFNVVRSCVVSPYFDDTVIERELKSLVDDYAERKKLKIKTLLYYSDNIKKVIFKGDRNDTGDKENDTDNYDTVVKIICDSSCGWLTKKQEFDEGGNYSVKFLNKYSVNQPIRSKLIDQEFYNTMFVEDFHWCWTTVRVYGKLSDNMDLMNYLFEKIRYPYTTPVYGKDNDYFICDGEIIFSSTSKWENVNNDDDEEDNYPSDSEFYDNFF